MMPILNPNNDTENQYNNAQVRTRNCIERCFGILKRRFPALALGLRIAKQTTVVAIVAAAVLHNIAIDEGNPVPDPEMEIEEVVMEDQGPVVALHDDGFATRQAIIQNFFR